MHVKPLNFFSESPSSSVWASSWGSWRWLPWRFGWTSTIFRRWTGWTVLSTGSSSISHLSDVSHMSDFWPHLTTTHRRTDCFSARTIAFSDKDLFLRQGSKSLATKLPSQCCTRDAVVSCPCLCWIKAKVQNTKNVEFVGNHYSLQFCFQQESWTNLIAFCCPPNHEIEVPDLIQMEHNTIWPCPCFLYCVSTEKNVLMANRVPWLCVVCHKELMVVWSYRIQESDFVQDRWVRSEMDRKICIQKKSSVAETRPKWVQFSSKVLGLWTKDLLFTGFVYYRPLPAIMT